MLLSKTRLIVVIVLLVISSTLALSKLLDHYGEDYTDKALQRALVGFTVARGLNGLISVVQDAEIAMQPAGVGVTVSPGEVLDPINDLIERFSLVMLVSASAIGVQKLLLAISAWNYFNIFVVIFWLSFSLYFLRQYKSSGQVNPWLIKTAIFLVVIRFATPIMALSNQLIFSTFLDQDYQSANQSLEAISGQLEEQAPLVTASTKAEDDSFLEPSLLEKAQQWMDNTKNQLDVTAKIEQYQTAAEQASKDVIQLITIFIVQTLLFPIFFLWLLWRFSLSLITRPVTKKPLTV